MKLFILAAGKGTRLMPLTKNIPKSLIDLGDGTTLLERQITSAIDAEIFNEIIIITGYKADLINNKIKDYNGEIKITPFYNPFYDMSNNLMSLWTVHFRMLEDDFMITNGDNMYIGNIFASANTDEDEIIQVTIDYKDEYDDDDMKVLLDENKNILYIHKQIDTKKAQGESIGLALVKGIESRKLFLNKLLHLAEKPEYLQKYWLEIFNSLVDDNEIIKSYEISHEQWYEVDFHPDIDTLKEIILGQHYKK